MSGFRKTASLHTNGRDSLGHQQLRRETKKSSIFGHFGQKWPILDSFWPKQDIFFKKALGTFFSRLQALTNCKVSEKSNERISRKASADR